MTNKSRASFKLYLTFSSLFLSYDDISISKLKEKKIYMFLWIIMQILIGVFSTQKHLTTCQSSILWSNPNLQSLSCHHHHHSAPPSSPGEQNHARLSLTLSLVSKQSLYQNEKNKTKLVLQFV